MSDLQNSEYLNQARKQLTEVYNTRKSVEYNQWLLNHKNAWAQPHTIVPFPPFVVSAALAPFKSSVESPTEDQIVTKALELYNKAKLSAPAAPPVSPIIETPVEVAPIVDTVSAPAIKVESVVEQVVEQVVEVEPVVEQVVEVEPVVEQSIVSNTPASAVTNNQYTSEIYKIYQPTPLPELLDTQVTSDVEEPTPLPSFKTIDKDLGAVPQPVEELANVKTSGGLLPSVLQRLQDMKSKWALEN